MVEFETFYVICKQFFSKKKNPFFNFFNTFSKFTLFFDHFRVQNTNYYYPGVVLSYTKLQKLFELCMSTLSVAVSSIHSSTID